MSRKHEKGVWYAGPTKFFIRIVLIGFLGDTTVVCVSLGCVFIQTGSFTVFLEATYFQFTSGPFDLFSRFQIAFMTTAVSFGFSISVSIYILIFLSN